MRATLSFHQPVSQPTNVHRAPSGHLEALPALDQGKGRESPPGHLPFSSCRSSGSEGKRAGQVHFGHGSIRGSESVCTLGFCDPAARPASKRRVLPPPAWGSPAGPRMSSAPGSGCAPAPTCPCPAAWRAPRQSRRGLRLPRGRRGGRGAPWRPGPGGGRLQRQHVSGSLIHLIPCAPPAGEP